MSKLGSSTRRPTPRRKTASCPAALARELSTKRRGELAELAFTLKATSLGFAVAKPYGDSERYDFILDAKTITARCHPERSIPIRLGNRNAKSKDPVSLAAAPGTNSISGHPPLYRVQVKCSTQLLNGLYRVNAHRRLRRGAVPYLPSEIDFLAAFIIPEDTWYILPVAAIRATSLLFRRRRDRRPGLYDQYREAWHLLRPK